MTTDHERWAEAAAILAWQGDNVHVYIAERMATLAMEGSEAGVARFTDIGRKIDALLRGPVH